jgi:DNA mismatch repair protein MutL
MRRPIRTLPDQVVNRIAAGEVIERPASVVKELVENSLDAGATRVTVEMVYGKTEDASARAKKRIERIRIVDDGHGMSPADARLALTRHATSKIASEHDLQSILTFGFRGEALPSILSVSRFTLRTRPAEADAGWEITSEGGVELTERAVAMPVGTEIEIRDLFFNVPARRKFLKSAQTEASSLIETLRSLALANWHVRFKLVSGQRTVFDLAPDTSLMGRVAAILGRESAEQMTALEHDGHVRLSGALGHPSLARRSPSNLYLFVNGRAVRDRLLRGALMKGYGALLHGSGYPLVVLFVEVDPERVDVNVHPAKAEVRFEDGGAVFHDIHSAVEAVLARAPWLDEPGRDTTYPEADEAAAYAAAREPRGAPYSGRPAYGRGYTPPPPAEDAQMSFEPAPATSPEAGGGFFSRLHYVGQVGRLFLVCETDQDLVLIDQHAAHERVTFQRLRQDYRGRGVATQRMLLPRRLEIDDARAPLLEERQDELASIGFGLRPFGDASFVLDELPAILKDANVDALVSDLLDELAATESLGAFERQVDAVLSRVACHGSIRAGARVHPEEARALLRDLDTVDFKANCPHGRPVVISYSLSEVAQWFERT